MSDKERGYVYRADIFASASQVWWALTDREPLARWCAPDVQITARRGGLFRASVDKITEFEAQIDVFEPGRRLRLLYLPHATLPPAGTVMVDDFLLYAFADRTMVRLLGSGVPATPEWDTQYRRLRVSWQHAMSRLKVLVEQEVKGGHGS